MIQYGVRPATSEERVDGIMLVMLYAFSFLLYQLAKTRARALAWTMAALLALGGLANNHLPTMIIPLLACWLGHRSARKKSLRDSENMAKRPDKVP